MNFVSGFLSRVFGTANSPHLPAEADTPKEEPGTLTIKSKTLTVTSLTSTNSEACLEAIRANSIKKLVIPEIALSEEELSHFLKNCPRLSSVAFCSPEELRKARDEEPVASQKNLMRRRHVIMFRDMHPNYAKSLDILFKDQKIRLCFCMSYHWPYPTAVHYWLEKKLPSVTMHHMQLRTPNGGYLK